MTYDILPKYYKKCRLQGHCEDECRVLHPELKKRENKVVNENIGGDKKISIRKNASYWHPTSRRLPGNANEEVTTKPIKLEDDPINTDNLSKAIDSLVEIVDKVAKRNRKILTTKQWITYNVYNNNSKVGEQDVNNNIGTTNNSKKDTSIASNNNQIAAYVNPQVLCIRES